MPAKFRRSRRAGQQAFGIMIGCLSHSPCGKIEPLDDFICVLWQHFARNKQNHHAYTTRETPARRLAIGPKRNLEV